MRKVWILWIKIFIFAKIKSFTILRLSAAVTLTAIFSVFLPALADSVGSPEGWATCSSVYSSADYALTGGNGGSLIVLRNDGSDMRDVILDAVNTHDVIVFDGSNGDFVLPSYISFRSLSGRTLIGVNGARLCTEFRVTQEIRDLLDKLNVNSLSQNAADNLGGTLSNGAQVAEQRELTIRQALIDRFDDPKEPYRYAGVFLFSGCSDIVLRNLDFYGPGSLDVGGADLLTLLGCDHVWVDHCRFTDGLDGNLDIVGNSDFITVSDSHFRYTDLAYNHPLSNLVSGSEVTDGAPQKCNISWIRCFWDEGCTGRMPFTSLGIHHILNCYWDCPKGTCIDAHDRSRILVENSFFTDKVGKALAVRHDDVRYEWRGSIWQGHASPVGNAVVEVPYSYSVMATSDVPAAIRESAGATLADAFTRELVSFPPTVDFGEIYAGAQVDSKVNLSAFGQDIPVCLTLTAPDGILLSSEPEGVYSSTLRLEAVDEHLFQADIYIKACFSSGGSVVTAIEASAPGRSFSIPVKAEVVSPGTERMETALMWAFDKGASSSPEASTAHPEVFDRASFSLGDKLYIHSSHNLGTSKAFALFNPTDAIDKLVDEDCCITFDVLTAPGYVFVPGRLKLTASRVGTDMCYIDIVCGRDTDSSRRLINGFQPDRSYSSTSSFSDLRLSLGSVGVGNRLQIKIYLYNMLANKQLALRDVVIEGDAYGPVSAIKPVVTDGNAVDIEYYDLMGRRLPHPLRGQLCVMRGTDGNVRLIVYPDASVCY